jgi:hypothetical protein
MTKKFLLRDLDSMDDMLDQHFSDDTSIKRSIGLVNAWAEKSTQQRENIAEKISKQKKINHPTKGKTLDDGWKKNVSDSLKGKSKPTRSQSHCEKYMRGVITPDATFNSVKECVDYYKIHECTVRDRIIKGEPGWHYVDGLTDKEKQKSELYKKSLKGKKSIVTPWGTFQSRKHAIEQGLAKQISNPVGKIDKGLVSTPTEYYYLDSK